MARHSHTTAAGWFKRQSSSSAKASPLLLGKVGKESFKVQLLQASNKEALLKLQIAEDPSVWDRA